jgi:hypothetical protein
MMSDPLVRKIRPATDAADGDAGGCSVCPHPADTHDEIGARYCAATAAGKFERGCVCAAGESTR